MSSLTADDTRQITNLIHGFFQCLDSKDPKGMEALFAKGGGFRLTTLEIDVSGDNLTGFVEGLNKKFPNAQHWEGNIVLTVDDEGIVTNKSYWQAQQNGSVVSYGTHHDTIIKEEGKWVFKHRDIGHSWRATPPATN
eukprot:TRINITY_DN4430_c0_g1_i1.p1 TRINITY_DN4430_c0_g1~~TRINITY_DN4430_c0_g1_i1.p1  ORF type:complete len:137 (+),score=24.51 TRINITY_DN4430_c0_g1_i1:43-453(+)